jgi:glycosyltransferase involved in cell wall biosynthesis
MRICLVYDCLFPYTVGGAERWYRNLGERLAADGHDVTYLTLRQWERGERGEVRGVRVVTAGPRMRLYAGAGRRRILPPLVFGLGVLVHLVRRGADYDVVHTASFPYFSLLAAAVARRLRGFRLVVDWHEVWSRDYWREYLGRPAGAIGHAVQALCLRVPQQAFCFSRLHGRRLREGGVRGPVTVLEGEYAGDLTLPVARPVNGAPVVVFAGRLIREKQAASLVPAIAIARERLPDLRGLILGDGPERNAVQAAVTAHGLDDAVSVPGFVTAEEVDSAMRSALCVALPSRREGYGMVVVEAASKATPSVVAAAPDNAAVELVDEGVNGFVAPTGDPADLAEAIVRVSESGMALRESTGRWFADNGARLSMGSSLQAVARSYAGDLR